MVFYTSVQPTGSFRSIIISAPCLLKTVWRKCNPMIEKCSDKLAWRLKMRRNYYWLNFLSAVRVYKIPLEWLGKFGSHYLMLSSSRTHTPTSYWRRTCVVAGNKARWESANDITRTNNHYQARLIWLVQRESTNVSHVT